MRERRGPVAAVLAPARAPGHGLGRLRGERWGWRGIVAALRFRLCRPEGSDAGEGKSLVVYCVFFLVYKFNLKVCLDTLDTHLPHVLEWIALKIK